jgi:hypothetical protein
LQGVRRAAPAAAAAAAAAAAGAGRARNFEKSEPAAGRGAFTPCTLASSFETQARCAADSSCCTTLFARRAAESSALNAKPHAHVSAVMLNTRSAM